MLTKYIKSLSKEDCPVVLSIADTTVDIQTETTIQRNVNRDSERHESGDIYLRAREIYFRARRQRPVRAASIF
jgi:ABC-type transporter lipoprotein component MlaA